MLNAEDAGLPVWFLSGRCGLCSQRSFCNRSLVWWYMWTIYLYAAPSLIGIRLLSHIHLCNMYYICYSTCYGCCYHTMWYYIFRIFGGLDTNYIPIPPATPFLLNKLLVINWVRFPCAPLWRSAMVFVSYLTTELVCAIRVISTYLILYYIFKYHVLYPFLVLLSPSFPPSVKYRPWIISSWCITYYADPVLSGPRNMLEYMIGTPIFVRKFANT